MNDSIYYGFEEHPEFPVEDERRFTIKIKKHPFVPFLISEYQNPSWKDKCKKCGYRKDAAVNLHE